MPRHAAAYTPAEDPYAGQRCASCPHLFYVDDIAGGPCRYAGMPSKTPSKACNCDDHMPRGADPFDEFDRSTGEIQAELQRLGHLDCGGWSISHKSPDVLACMCGTRFPIVRKEAADAASS
jgi:hypothetical protein